MGFYYGSGEPPKGNNKPGSFREAMLITWVVFTVLAKPLGILFGGIAYLLLVFFLFTVHGAAGGAALALPFVLAVGRGIWEWRNPPPPP